MFRLIETMMNLRSRWSGICTGDQGIFVRRDLLALIDGIPDQPLMEDIELSKRLRRYARPICLDASLTASARRWQQHGVLPTILLMWRLRLEYFFGVAPDVLARGITAVKPEIDASDHRVLRAPVLGRKNRLVR
jgi:hypothetical protein